MSEHTPSSLGCRRHAGLRRGVGVLVAWGLGACAPTPQDVLYLAEAEQPEFASLCDQGSFLQCENFEAPQLGSPPWYENNHSASVELDRTRAYRGFQSVRVHTDAELTDPVRQGELHEVESVPTDELYLRTFLYVPSPAPEWEVRLLGYLQRQAPFEGVSVFVLGGKLYVGGPGGDVTFGTFLPLDRWVCLEWHVRASDAGAMELWMDDAAEPAVKFTGDTQLSPGLGLVVLGAALFGAPATLPAREFWFDELVMDDERVGCAR